MEGAVGFFIADFQLLYFNQRFKIIIPILQRLAKPVLPGLVSGKAIFADAIFLTSCILISAVNPCQYICRFTADNL